MNDERGHIRPLTSLRFIAALLVFIHHLPTSYGPKLIQGPIGAVGVSFFFVLSGFILTYVYSDRIDKWSSIRKFWFARWARIWPLHLVTLLICVFGVVGITNSFREASDTTSFALNLLLLQVWVPDNSWSMGFNHVSWSIATEAFFYLVFPLFILMSPKRFWLSLFTVGGATLVGIGLSQLAVSTCLTTAEQGKVLPMVIEFFHVNPLARLWEFLGGMATGKIFLSYRLTSTNRFEKPNWVRDTKAELWTITWLALYMAVLFKLYFVAYAQDNLRLVAECIGYAGGSFMFMLVIYTFATRNGVVSKLLSTKLFVYLGEISFAFYMIHQLVIRVMPNVVTGFSENGFSACALSTFLISLGLASLLHGLVEIPARNLLVNLYRQKWKQAASVSWGGFRDFLAGGRGQFAVVSAVVGSLMIFHAAESRYERQFASERVRPIVLDSDLRCLPLAFGEDAILHGAKIENQKNGGLQIKLVWEKQKDVTRHRFVHVVDAAGKIVCNPVVVAQQKNFVSLPANRKFIEVIELSPKQLAGGMKIGIGLYNHDHGAAVINGGGELSMGGCRLDVATLTDFLPATHNADHLLSPTRQAATGTKTIR